MTVGRLLYIVFAACISMIGYTINNSLAWAIVNYLFAPLSLIKWMICHEITLNVIKTTFSWFFV